MGHNESDSLWGTRPNALVDFGRVLSGWTIPKSPIRNTNNSFTGYATRLSVNDGPTRLTAETKLSKSKRTVWETLLPRISTGPKPFPGATRPKTKRGLSKASYRIDPISGKKVLDVTQLNYRYDVYNHTEAAKRRNRIDPARRVLNTDITPGNEEILISKDTAFINDDGQIVTQTIIRQRQSEFDFLNTYIINIYPDTTVWVNDFNNAYNEPYMRMYFSHPGYNDYPVVGVSWEQANAFCVWRTNLLHSAMTPDRMVEPYRLPTEAEWEYAARAGKSENSYPWDDNGTASDKGCFYANFKPMKGNYLQDGNLITSRVGIYPPDQFGLYDMAGNVSEWTSTAYTESVDQYTSDMNPDYRYNAAKEDPYRMKRKIVRGGSWKDVSNFVRSDIRMWEYQNERGRSCIRFRSRTHAKWDLHKEP